MKKTKRISLVDIMAGKLGLVYVSDLHVLAGFQRRRLNRILENDICKEEFPDHDWFDACKYLTGQKCGSKEEAVQCLEDFLGEK